MDERARPKQVGAKAKTRPAARRRATAGEPTTGLTPDQKVDEASIESMDGSDPPGYLPIRVGAPTGRQGAVEPDEAAIGQLACEIWEREGRLSGHDEEYRHRAREELRGRAAANAAKFKASG